MTGNSSDPPGRLTTGIPGLDTILSGGLLRRSSAILQGAPGSGKTVFANQIAFHQAARGEQVLYVTLLVESHAALMRHLGPLAFFDAGVVGDRLVYLSGYHALREAPTALTALLQQELVTRRPALLILDALNCVGELYGPAALRQLLHELQVSVEAANCTCVLTSAHEEGSSTEDAVADTIIFLRDAHVGLRSVRDVRINKARGTSHLAGQHVFTIDGRGVTIFPRLEALHRAPSRPIAEDASQARFDHTVLDEMLGGGFRAGSSTLVLGASGTGKTLLGLTFLAAGLRRNEPAVHAGLYESADRLLAAGESIGLDLRRHVDEGRLHVDWQAPVELLLDEWGHRLLETVRERRPTRVFIDGVNALLEAAAYGDRLAAFLTALFNELRTLGVTTMISAELRPIIGPGVDVPLPGVSPLVENTIFLRYVELRSHLFRLIGVLKVRESAHQTAMREFQITSSGLEIASTFESAEAILTGSPRTPTAIEPPEPDRG